MLKYALQTRLLANMAARFETVDKHGISRNNASIRGATRKRNGPMPMDSIASTSSETCMVPNSAVNAAPMRAASMMPVSKGPSSREKANQPHQWYRIDTGAFGVAEKTGGTKRNASMLNPLERFFERIHNEPKHA